MIRKILMTGVLAMMAGCQPYASSDEYANGLVVVLSGVDGRGAAVHAVCNGLEEGGVTYAVEIFDWTSPLGVLDSLQNIPRNRTQAGDIAGRIGVYRRRYPGRPVYIVGISGGGGIATWAAEALPADEPADGVVLLAPALSPGYDLSVALSRSQGGIVAFYSENDWLILGLGTQTWGTIDGEFTDSAGRVGFTVPEGADPALYAGLHQVGWRPEMATRGHWGGHGTSGSMWFVRDFVAPLITSGFTQEALDDLDGPVEWNIDGSSLSGTLD
jgi:pimeloyl-ACP methyl ester carboxylesterase